MSLSFNNIVNKIDRAVGTNSTTYSLANKAIDVNLALDEALEIIFKQGGRWQFDDSNHTKDPIITTNIVVNQRDYHFTVDEQSNVILDFTKVQIKDSSGTWHDIERTDVITEADDTVTGLPTKYGLLGNGIFFDLVPDFSTTNGLRAFINREASYFTSTDTTKTAGIDGLCHDFLYLKPAYEFARDKGMAIAERLYRDLSDARQRLVDRYKTKERQYSNRIAPSVENNK